MPRGDLNFKSLQPITSNIIHTADCWKSAFFLGPFFFVILHSWRVWIIYNFQIIFWIVSASGRRKGNFNDAPGSAKASFTVSQPFKLCVISHARMLDLNRRRSKMHVSVWGDKVMIVRALDVCLFQYWRLHLHKNHQDSAMSVLTKLNGIGRLN